MWSATTTRSSLGVIHHPSPTMSAEAPEREPCSGTSTPATPPRARSPYPLALTPSKATVSAASAIASPGEPSPRLLPSTPPTPDVRSKGKGKELQAQDEEAVGKLSVSSDARSELRQQLLREKSWRPSPGRSRASSSAISAKGKQGRLSQTDVQMSLFCRRKIPRRSVHDATMSSRTQASLFSHCESTSVLS